LLTASLSPQAEARSFKSLSLFGRNLLPGDTQVDLRDFLPGNDCQAHGIFFPPADPCCEGLVKKQPCFPSVNSVGVLASVCVPCGNGKCERFECHANCPQDCKEGIPEEVPESLKSSFDSANNCHNWGLFLGSDLSKCCEGTRPKHELVNRRSCIPLCFRFGGYGMVVCLRACTYCGDGVCGPLECRWNCPEDCVLLPRPRCGDGVCNWFESPLTCSNDCWGYWCGDGDCDKGERVSCPKDCFEEAGEETVEDAVVERGEGQPENRNPDLLSLISKLLRRRST
jgi:hypothetical protein